MAWRNKQRLAPIIRDSSHILLPPFVAGPALSCMSSVSLQSTVFAETGSLLSFCSGAVCER